MPDERTNTASRQVITAAMRVHSVLGPGMLEHAYRRCLAHELRLHGVRVDEEVSLPLRYRRFDLDVAYRVDLLVDDRVIVEVKAISTLKPVHAAQLLSYLRLADRSLGLLLNFHVLRLKHGIRRIVNDHVPDYWR